MIKIGLEDLKFVAHHGVLDEERANGNYFIINIKVWYDTLCQFEKDELSETYDYSILHQIIKEEMQISVKLLENVAYRILNRVANTDKKIKKIYIKIQKRNPPIKADVKTSFVELKKRVNRKK